MTNLTRDEAERLLTGLRTRREAAIDAGDTAAISDLDKQIAEIEAQLDRSGEAEAADNPNRTRNVILAIVAVFAACGVCGSLFGDDSPEANVPQTPADSAAAALAQAEADSVAQVEARFGSAPTISAWDGGSIGVEMFLEEVARDPESVDVENCTQPVTTESYMELAEAVGETLSLPDGWVTICEWAARNGFGGMNRTRNTFVLRDRDGYHAVIWTDMDG